jgi:hypothetical protein
LEEHHEGEEEISEKVKYQSKCKRILIPWRSISGVKARASELMIQLSKISILQ